MNVRVCGLVEGLMVYWDEVKNATQYHVHLYIGDWNRRYEFINGYREVVNAKKESVKEIAIVDVDRNVKYYSFQGLARIHVEHKYDHGRYVCKNETGRNYYVMVEAEGRDGKIIDTSDRVIGKVLQMDGGYASEV